MAERKAKPEGTDATDLRTRTPDQMQELLLNLRREQFNLRFQRATGQAEGTARVRIVRRSIARVKTILHERAQAAVGGK